MLLRLTGWILQAGLALFGLTAMVCAQTPSFPNVKVGVSGNNRVVIEGSTTAADRVVISGEYAGVWVLEQNHDFQASILRENQLGADEGPGTLRVYYAASSFRYFGESCSAARSSDCALVAWFEPGPRCPGGK